MSSADDDVRDISSAVTGLAVLFATSIDAMDGLQVADESLPADQRLEMEQLKTRVRAAIEQLPEKEKKLLVGYYFQGKTLEEAGAEIGQSKSWASRLHARAIEELKRLLAEDEGPAKESRRRKAHGESNAVGSGGGGSDRATKDPGPGQPAAQAGGK